jgi:hypothetical protein
MGKSYRDKNHNRCKKNQRNGDFGSINCRECKGCSILGSGNHVRRTLLNRQRRAQANRALIQDKDIPVFKTPWLD